MKIAVARLRIAVREPEIAVAMWKTAVRGTKIAVVPRFGPTHDAQPGAAISTIERTPIPQPTPKTPGLHQAGGFLILSISLGSHTVSSGRDPGFLLRPCWPGR